MIAQLISDDVGQKRMEGSRKLIRRLPIKATERVFLTDEKNYYVNPPINQNGRVLSRGSKVNVSKRRPLIERAKFASHVTVSAGVCYGGKGAEVNVKYYVKSLLPSLVADCNARLPGGFIVQHPHPHTPHD